MSPSHSAWLWSALAAATWACAGCGSDGDNASAGPILKSPDAGDAWTSVPDAANDTQTVPQDADAPADDGPTPDAPVEPPADYDPCQVGSCWDAFQLSSACGTATLDEDFSTGLYNVHAFPLRAPAQVPVELKVARTGGDWNPALLLHDEQGTTIHDGEHSQWDPSLKVELTGSGRAADWAGLRVTAQQERHLSLFLTGWHVIDGGFSPAMPTQATYSLTSTADCVPSAGCKAPGALLSPPNFDPQDLVDGYYLLPPSEPAGLYTRKEDGCSRGTKLLINVLYTVAVRWKELRPSLAPITIRDLNKGPCSTVNHETHDDGTHADILVDCATEVGCADDQPAIDLAKLFVDTGHACGVLNNNVPAQGIVNPYFESECSYTPWHNTFMRSVDGHTGHFHIRVKKPDDTCN